MRELTVRARVYATTSTPCTGYSTTFVPVAYERHEPHLVTCKLLDAALEHGTYEITFKRLDDDDER